MKIIFYIILSFFVWNVSFAAIRMDRLKIRGTIYSYNEDFVYLKTKSGRKAIALRSMFSKQKLKSRNEVTIYLDSVDFMKLRSQVMLYPLLKKYKKR